MNNVLGSLIFKLRKLLIGKEALKVTEEKKVVPVNEIRGNYNFKSWLKIKKDTIVHAVFEFIKIEYSLISDYRN